MTHRQTSNFRKTLGAMALSCVAFGTAAFGASSEPAIPRPSIPNHVYKIGDFSAASDGKTNATAAFKRAIAAVEKGGGGTLEITEGTYLIDPITLASHMNLHLDKGAVIKMTPLDPAAKEYENLIVADNCADIAITGEGTIDGQGQFTWDRYRKVLNPKTGKREAPKATHRPYMVVLQNCTRVLVEGVTFTNSPSFHLVPKSCRDVVIDGAHFVAPADAPNTDALDPSGWNYLITRCTFDVGDDCIAVKASARDGTPEKPSCENFTITECTFKHGHGLSVGGQSNGCLRTMRVRDCTFENTDAGIRLKAGRGAGGLVEDLTYENITMKHVKVAIYITSYYPDTPKDPAAEAPQAVTATTPVWRNIRIKNVKAEGGETAGIIYGLPEAPVENVVMEDVHLSAEKGMKIVDAKGIVFVNSTIESKDKKPLVVEKAEVKGLEAKGQ